MKVRTSLIGLLVVCGIGVCSIGTAAAQPATPTAGYKIEEKYTQKSPDGAITIEQYLRGSPQEAAGVGALQEKADQDGSAKLACAHLQRYPAQNGATPYRPRSRSDQYHLLLQ